MNIHRYALKKILTRNYFPSRRSSLAVLAALADESCTNATPTKSALPGVARQLQITWFMRTNKRINWHYNKTYSEWSGLLQTAISQSD